MENTQKPRKTLLFILMFTLPLTIWYFSPVVVQFATWNNTFALGHITFLLLFLSTIFLGRTWCSYICPFGAFQDVMAMVIPLRQTNNKFFKNLRQIIGVLWLTASLYLIAFIGFKKIDIFFPFQRVNGPSTNFITFFTIFIMTSTSFITIYFIIMGIFALVTYFAGKRALCKYLCINAPLIWLGILIKKSLPIPTLKLIFIKEQCSSCDICRSVCPMDLDTQAFVNKGKLNEHECILCGECVSHCPKAVIKRGFKN